MKRRGILVVISGFSGVGKGTVVKNLIAKYDNYALSVSMTTRNPRPGEIDGVHYFFTDKENFLKTVEDDGLLEHACYCDNYYGTPKKFVEQRLEEGKDVILEIEVQGALQIKEKYPDALLLFVAAPTADTIKDRLSGRGTETEEVIAKRLTRAMEEQKIMHLYDYIVINDDLDECVVNTNNIIEAAHCTPDRLTEFISDLETQFKNITK